MVNEELLEEVLILERIRKVKEEIATLGEIRPGSLSVQFNVCGTRNCKCKDKENPRKHGPYYQLSYTRNGRGTSEFVRAEDLETVRKQLEDYKRFSGLKDEWVTASLELSQLRRARKKSEGIRK